jgi:hypothetical protein
MAAQVWEQVIDTLTCLAAGGDDFEFDLGVHREQAQQFYACVTRTANNADFDHGAKIQEKRGKRNSGLRFPCSSEDVTLARDLICHFERSEKSGGKVVPRTRDLDFSLRSK